MNNLRKYGERPFRVAVIHGGPGAPGEMASVAEKLSSEAGILEPLQTATSIEEQVEELKNVLENNGEAPVILIGFSWGAWLSFIFAANHPSIIKKLILVGSGPFKEKYASTIIKTRLNRLNNEERKEAKYLIKKLSESNTKNKEKELAKFGKLMSKADSFNPLSSTDKLENEDFQQEIYHKVWREASELRKSGELLELGKQVECPVVAIHGDYDPHPYKGVKEPLSQVVKEFRFVLLEKCGHKPWIEKEVRNKFYKILEKELKE